MASVYGSQDSPVTIHLGSRSNIVLDKPLQMVDHVNIKGKGSGQTTLSGSGAGVDFCSVVDLLGLESS